MDVLLRDTLSRRPTSCQPASLLRARRRNEYRDFVDWTVTLEKRVRAHLDLVRAHIDRRDLRVARVHQGGGTRKSRTA